MGVGARRQFISLTQHHWNRDLDSVRYVLVSCHNLESKAIRDEPDNVAKNLQWSLFQQNPCRQDKRSWPYQPELSPKSSGRGSQATMSWGNLYL